MKIEIKLNELAINLDIRLLKGSKDLFLTLQNKSAIEKILK